MSEPADLRTRVFVPVAVDAEREVDRHRLLRATYFVATSDAPASVWELELPPLARLHGLGALGTLGVVFSALRQTEETGREVTTFDLFTDPDDVSAIFSLEDEGVVSIHLEDIWLPLSWCEEASPWGGERSQSSQIERGDVFRVSADLFQQAYRYGTGDITIDQLMQIDSNGQVFASPEESEALKAWAQGQIEVTKQAAQERKSPLTLEYR